MGLRRLYDLPVFAAAGTLSITSLNVAIANGVVTSELDDKPSNEPYDGATVPRGASVAYATTTPTEHFPFNQLSQQSETLSRLLSLGQSIIPCNGKTSFVAG